MTTTSEKSVSLFEVEYRDHVQVTSLLKELKRFGFFLGRQSLAIKGLLNAMDQAILEDISPTITLADEARLG